VAGTGGTTAAHAAEAIGMQLEAATRKAELPSYGHMPTSRSLAKEPVRLGV